MTGIGNERRIGILAVAVRAFDDASAEGRGGSAGRFAYGTSKAAINALTRYVATQYGKRGIRCNAVAPGLILSGGVFGRETSAALGVMFDNTLTSRLGDPRDVANAVAFLMSDDAALITGHILVVDGGHTSHQTHWAQLSAITGADAP